MKWTLLTELPFFIILIHFYYYEKAFIIVGSPLPVG